MRGVIEWSSLRRTVWRCAVLGSVVGAGVLPLAAAGQFQLPDAGDLGLQGELVTLIANIITKALLLVGVLALAFLVYGGFLYITARGEESQIEQAKKAIYTAVLGIIVIGLAWSVVTFVINAFTGDGGAQVNQ